MLFKSLLYFFLTTLLMAESSYSPNFSYGNINVNYLDWSKKSENESYKGDFSYLGFEGGAGWSGAELYGFLNIENPTHSYSDDSPDELRFSSFIDLDIEIKNNFKFHIQNYALNSDPYYVNDFVLGLGYKFQSDFGVWFRPFIGIHYSYDPYYSDLNGYMGGWLFSYDFTILEYKFNLFHWNEIEFGRDKAFYLDDAGTPIGDGESWGLNGAVSLWVELSKHYTIGLQYRYADNKLGSPTYQSAAIYTFKYNF